MGKAVKTVLKGALVAGLIVGAAVLTGGISLVPSIAAFSAGGVAVAGVAGGLAISGAVAASLVSLGISVGTTLLSSRPKLGTSRANAERLRANIDPRTPRKTVWGETALATDIRDQEYTGDQEFLHTWIVCAAHSVHAIKELWFDDKRVWTVGGGVEGDAVGYLTVTPILEGSAANAINISSRMGSSRRYTGCAYLYLRYKLTGNNKKAESPYAQGITSRITIRGEGIRAYDPRQDSTVPGGSGAHRADNQATWTWGAHCRNPSLALLNYLLGWRINGLLSVGKGIPPNRIDLESFAIAANICDETVAKPGGGTEPRYRADGLWTEGDNPSAVIDMLKASMNADLDDMNGRLRVTVFHNDLATPIADFDDEDILGDFAWTPVANIEDAVNIVRGGYTDASNQSLYQMVDYPQAETANIDGIDRIDTFDLPAVQSAGQAQRLAGLRLRRNFYAGTFRCELQATGWRIEKNSVIRLSFLQRGWVNKLFRVVEMDLRQDGVVPVVLREEDPDLYDDAGVLAPISALEPTPFNYQLDPAYQVLTTVTRNVPRGTYSAGETYIEGDQVVFSGSTYQLTVASSTGNAPPDVTRWILVAAAGTGVPGDDGAPGYSVLVSNEAHVVSTAPDGSGGTYTSAGGTMQILRGASVLSPVFSIAAATPGTGWITINTSTGVYTVTDPGVDLATATLRATVDSINFDRTYTLAKSKQGIGSPTVRLTADRQGFTYLDNVADPSSQTITLTAALDGLAGPAVFTTSPTVSLAGTGNTRTLAIADFDGNRQVTITATVGSLSDRFTVVRVDQSTAGAGATVGENLVANSTLSNNTASWVVPAAVSRVAGGGGTPIPWYFRADPNSARSVVANGDVAKDVPGSRILHLSAWAYADVTANTSEAVIVWQDNAGATIGFSVLPMAPAAGTWQQFGGYFVPPATATRWVARFDIPAFGSGFAGVGGLRVADTQPGATVGAPAGTLVAGVPAEDIVAGGSPVQVIGLSALGTSAVITKLMDDGTTVTAMAVTDFTNTGGPDTTLSQSIEGRFRGGTWATLTGSSASVPVDTFGQGILPSSGTFANASGETRICEFRCVTSVTGGATGVVEQSTSFLKV